jgi:hypothetical protein
MSAHAALSALGPALRLHRHLVGRYLRDHVLCGPDPGVRFNLRIGRFIKSMAPAFPWGDDLVYMHAQSHWMVANGLLHAMTGEAEFLDLALACGEQVLRRQLPSGGWRYPNPEWRDRVATVEGCYAAIGLLDAYARTGHSRLLYGAVRWYGCLVRDVGFSALGSAAIGRSFNYFAGYDVAVPNNNTLALWMMGRLYRATGDRRFLEHAPPVRDWLRSVQLPAGELPYRVSTRGRRGQVHYLCFQYNAFEFDDLVQYRDDTGDAEVDPLIARLAGFLPRGLGPDGWARHDCAGRAIRTPYYTSALGHALRLATRRGLGDHDRAADRCFQTVRKQLGADGAPAWHSARNHGLFTDRRGYPRYLAILLHHLVREAADPDPAPQA